MDDVTADLSTALCQYLGFENRRWSPRDHRAVVQIFGDVKAAELRERVADLLREVDTFPVDWSRQTLNEAIAEIRATLRQRHPELSDDGREALVSRFAWSWR